MEKEFIVHASLTPENTLGWEVHTHDYTELVYYVKGEGYTRAGTGLPFKVGTAMIVPSGVLHGSLSRNGYKCIVIGCHALVSDKTRVSICEDNGEKDLYKLFDLLYRLIHESKTENATTITFLVNTIVSMVEREREVGVVENVCNKIIANFTDCEFDIASVIADTGYTDDYFRTLFKAKKGVTPLQYLLSLRLENAHGLLKTGGFTVREIAQASGFSDPLYFSRFYKKRYGVSPKNNKGESENDL